MEGNSNQATDDTPQPRSALYADERLLRGKRIEKTVVQVVTLFSEKWLLNPITILIQMSGSIGEDGAGQSNAENNRRP